MEKENAKNFEIRKSPSGSTYKVYTFECSECGSDIKAQSSHLKTHSGKCMRCTQKGKPYHHILNELIHTCKKKNKVEVSLNYDEFINIIEDSKCHYCDKPLIFNKHTRDENSNHVSRAYQLDRKDNNLGYHLDNVVTCCWNCNRIKSDIYSYEDFMKLSPILKELHNK